MNKEILKSLINLVRYSNDIPDDQRSEEFNKALGTAIFVIQEALPNKKWSEIFLDN